MILSGLLASGANMEGVSGGWTAWMSQPEAWVALLTLVFLETVLGIDNVIFISVLAGRLPEGQRDKARNIGLMLAAGTRVVLLFGITWLMTLTATLFEVPGIANLSFGEESHIDPLKVAQVTGRDLVMLIGGLFLIWKSTTEIHHSLEGAHGEKTNTAVASFGMVLLQIALLDIVFSFDSVLTAVGMADHIPVMVIAVLISVGIMLLAAGPISRFVERHPTIKMLALSFLILVGLTLMADAADLHIPKGYVYVAIGFSLGVEALNMKMRKNATEPVHLVPKVEDSPQ